MAIFGSVFGPSKKELWSQFAASINAQFVPGGFWKADRMISEVGPWQILLDTYTQSNGQSSAPYTRIRSLFKNKDDFAFKLYRKRWIHKIGLWFGRQNIAIGDAAFDERFILKSNDPEKVRQLFGDSRIKALAMQQPRIIFKTKDYRAKRGEYVPGDNKQLYFQCYGIIKQPIRLESLFELFSLTLVRLVKIGSAFDSQPDVKL